MTAATPTRRMPVQSLRKCPVSGLAITYNGYGRPPLYHPTVVAQRQKEQRARQYAQNKARRAAASAQTV